MAHTVIGLFKKRTDVDAVVVELEQLGIDASDISIVMKDNPVRYGADIENDMTEGALSGAATGGILGALAGLLSATVIPGLGAFLIGGPIASTLGLGAVAAGAISGATTGVLAGGLIGGLIGLGLSDDDAEEYEEYIRRGSILVAVPTNGEMEEDVRQILADHNAVHIRSIQTHRNALPTQGYAYPAFGMKGGERKSKAK